MKIVYDINRGTDQKHNFSADANTDQGRAALRANLLAKIQQATVELNARLRSGDPEIEKALEAEGGDFVLIFGNASDFRQAHS